MMKKPKNSQKLESGNLQMVIVFCLKCPVPESAWHLWLSGIGSRLGRNRFVGLIPGNIEAYVEPTITLVPSGFSGYIWLDTKIVLKKEHEAHESFDLGCDDISAYSLCSAIQACLITEFRWCGIFSVFERD